MTVVDVRLPHEQYQIVVAAGALDELGKRVRECAPADACALISDKAVGAQYAATATDSLSKNGYQVVYSEFPGGEQHKSLESVQSLYTALLDAKLERVSPVIALGGGVVGDTAGFVAATYWSCQVLHWVHV